MITNTSVLADGTNLLVVGLSHADLDTIAAGGFVTAAFTAPGIEATSVTVTTTDGANAFIDATPIPARAKIFLLVVPAGSVARAKAHPGVVFDDAHRFLRTVVATAATDDDIREGLKLWNKWEANATHHHRMQRKAYHEVPSIN